MTVSIKNCVSKLQGSIIFINALYFPGDNSSVHFGKQNRGETV